MITTIALDQIYEDDNFNCRGQITMGSIRDLAADIQQRGLLQPIVVCKKPVTFTDEHDIGWRNSHKPYMLVAGYRRYKALTYLAKNNSDYQNVPANIQEFIGYRARLEDNFAENIARLQLTPSQEAAHILKLKDADCSEEYIRKRFAKSASWVKNRLQLAKLPPEVQTGVDDKLITLGEAAKLAEMVIPGDGVTHQKVMKVFRDMKERKFRQDKRNQTKTTEEVAQAVAPTKRRPTTDEVIGVIAGIVSEHGQCLASRALAWSLGNIELDDLAKDVNDGFTFAPFMETEE